MAIQWRDNVYYLDSIQLPNDEKKYWIKDTEAREAIEALSNATHFLGVTTTALTDGATTNPIIIDSKSVTAQSGDIVIYNAGTALDPENKEFIFNGTAWQEFGDPSINNLGNMAYANTASGQVPSTSVIFETSETGLQIVSSVTNNLSMSFSTFNSSGPGLIKMPISYQTIYLSDCIDATFETYDRISDLQSVVTSLTTSYQTTGYQQHSGVLPSLKATSSLTASVDGTTLTFSLSSLGFSRGEFPEYAFPQLQVIDSMEYSSDYLTIADGGSVCTGLGVTGEVVDYVASPYYSFGLTGSINVTTSNIVATTTSISVTVSPDPKS